MKLRVILGPEIWRTRVVDALTDEEVENVVVVHMEARPDHHRIVRVELFDVEVQTVSSEESR